MSERLRRLNKLSRISKKNDSREEGRIRNSGLENRNGHLSDRLRSVKHQQRSGLTILREWDKSKIQEHENTRMGLSTDKIAKIVVSPKIKISSLSKGFTRGEKKANHEAATNNKINDASTRRLSFKGLGYKNNSTMPEKMKKIRDDLGKGMDKPASAEPELLLASESAGHATIVKEISSINIDLASGETKANSETTASGSQENDKNYTVNYDRTQRQGDLSNHAFKITGVANLFGKQPNEGPTQNIQKEVKSSVNVSAFVQNIHIVNVGANDPDKVSLKKKMIPTHFSTIRKSFEEPPSNSELTFRVYNVVDSWEKEYGEYKYLQAEKEPTHLLLNFREVTDTMYLTVLYNIHLKKAEKCYLIKLNFKDSRFSRKFIRGAKVLIDECGKGEEGLKYFFKWAIIV
ncbi:hypothetical protein DASC09_044020 [Saccharomycopsis crataegensis]|uniref:Uncharacterized protein n=1 Tax=Saccharomycopsis crataegensis TaxID=43959 RepID=A0AAV5QQD1_9ASCO|nr:hypothetical protein DASC09_044020 [Saccharomycopsis crataegensis]